MRKEVIVKVKKTTDGWRGISSSMYLKSQRKGNGRIEKEKKASSKKGQD